MEEASDWPSVAANLRLVSKELMGYGVGVGVGENTGNESSSIDDDLRLIVGKVTIELRASIDLIGPTEYTSRYPG